MTYLPDTHAVHAGRTDLSELGVHALPGFFDHVPTARS